MGQHRAAVAIFLTVSLAALSFCHVENLTHVWKISQITGKPYFQVLGAWNRLQASPLTDTDTANFDAEVGLDSEENTNGESEATQL